MISTKWSASLSTPIWISFMHDNAVVHQLNHDIWPLGLLIHDVRDEVHMIINTTKFVRKGEK
jgi:hypothetical protein